MQLYILVRKRDGHTACVVLNYWAYSCICRKCSDGASPVHVVATGNDVERVAGRNMVLPFIASKRCCAKVLAKLSAHVECTIHNGMLQGLTMLAMD